MGKARDARNVRSLGHRVASGQRQGRTGGERLWPGQPPRGLPSSSAASMAEAATRLRSIRKRFLLLTAEGSDTSRRRPHARAKAACPRGARSPCERAGPLGPGRALPPARARALRARPRGRVAAVGASRALRRAVRRGPLAAPTGGPAAAPGGPAASARGPAAPARRAGRLGPARARVRAAAPGAAAAAGGGALRGLDLAVVDRAAPLARLLLVHHHVGLEPVQVGPHGALDVPRPTRELLDQRAGLDVHADLDPGQPGGKLVERHDALVAESLDDVALDPLIGALFVDLGLELPRDAPDLRLERNVRLVLLAHAGDPVHELGPLLELRELVVDGRDRHADVDRLLDGHAPTLADAVGFVLPAAIALVVAVLAAAQAGDQALARLLGDAARTAGVLDLVVHDVRRRALHLLARLLHGLLQRTGPVAEVLQPARALDRQRRRRGKPGAHRNALQPRDRAVLASARLRVRHHILSSFTRHPANSTADRVAQILGHMGTAFRLPLSRPQARRRKIENPEAVPHPQHSGRRHTTAGLTPGRATHGRWCGSTLTPALRAVSATAGRRHRR